MGLGDAVGFVKIVADAKYNEILGAHLIGPDVTEAAARADPGPAVGPDRRRGRPQRLRPPDPVRSGEGEAIHGIAGHMINLLALERHRSIMWPGHMMDLWRSSAPRRR